MRGAEESARGLPLPAEPGTKGRWRRRPLPTHRVLGISSSMPAPPPPPPASPGSSGPQPAPSAPHGSPERRRPRRAQEARGSSQDGGGRPKGARPAEGRRQRACAAGAGPIAFASPPSPPRWRRRRTSAPRHLSVRVRAGKGREARGEEEGEVVRMRFAPGARLIWGFIAGFCAPVSAL